MGGDVPYAADVDDESGLYSNTPGIGEMPTAGGIFGGSMNPALIAAAAQVFSSAVAPSPAGPSRADAANNLAFDNSGFVVDFGPGGATSSKSTGVPSWLLAAGLAGAVLVGLVWIKKKA